MRLSRALFASLLPFTALACGDDAQFTARHAAEFAQNDRITVSVLGVFKDGIMSADAWDALGPKLARGFHTQSCPSAYAADRLLKDPRVGAAIDEYARDNGITDDLLGELAPVSEGDLLVAFTVAGHAPKSADGGAAFIHTSPSPVPMRGGMMQRQPRTQGGRSGGTRGAYEVAVTFYSPKLHRSVALLAMTYKGASEDEALALFVDKLAAFAPHSTCTGITNAVLDSDRIRALGEQGSSSGTPAP